jgi:hypothetical protein
VESLFDKEDAGPLLSRCVDLALTNQGLSTKFAKRVQEIATEAGMNGQPIDAYLKLGKQLAYNMRAMLQAVESGAMAGGES